MQLIGLLLLAQHFTSKPHTSCADANEFWTADNLALGNQSLNSLIQAPVTAISENFAIYSILYKNAGASFKVIRIQNAEEWKRVANEVEILRKVSHLPRVTTMLDCVEGENYVGIFMLPFNNNLLEVVEKNEAIEALSFTEIIYNSARALNELHIVNVAHGRILAENFYVKGEDKDQVLIGNFAQAKRQENAHQASHVVSSYATDAFEFALMVLTLENKDFRKGYYELLKTQQSTDYRDAQFQSSILKLVQTGRKNGDSNLQKLVFSWLTTSFTNKGSLLPKIVKDIESLIKMKLVEERRKNINLPNISKDTLISYLGGKGVDENMKINELVDKPLRNRGEALIGKAKSKLKESLDTDKKPEEQVQAASSWFYTKYKAFCDMLNNLKKKIVHSFFLFNFKVPKKTAAVKVEEVKAAPISTAEKSPVAFYVDILPEGSQPLPEVTLAPTLINSPATVAVTPHVEKVEVQALQHSRLLSLMNSQNAQTVSKGKSPNPSIGPHLSSVAAGRVLTPGVKANAAKDIVSNLKITLRNLLKAL